MKKKVVSVILLSSLLLSGCSFNKSKAEKTEVENEKYVVTLYTYQGKETYEIKDYSVWGSGLHIVTNDNKELILKGDYKIEVIK